MNARIASELLAILGCFVPKFGKSCHLNLEFDGITRKYNSSLPQGAVYDI